MLLYRKEALKVNNLFQLMQIAHLHIHLLIIVEQITYDGMNLTTAADGMLSILNIFHLFWLFLMHDLHLLRFSFDHFFPYTYIFHSFKSPRN